MPGGVRVKAPLGGNATIHCSYDRGYEKYPKYFSKGQQETELARQDRKVTWSRDWRFSLEDDTETRVFTVTMRNLSVDDAGVYWCGVDRWISDIQTEVNLDVVQHVVDDVTTQNVSVTGVLLNADVYETGSEDEAAVIKCPYREHYKTLPKYFCKGIYKQCQTLIETDGKTEWVIEGNLSLNDNKEKNMFVVTIKTLSAGDAGTYGCAIKITGQDPFTVVHLTVMKAEKPCLSTAKTTVSTLPTTEMPTSTVMSSSGGATATTGSSTQSTVSLSLSGSDVLMYAGGVFGAVLLVFIVTFCVFKCRVMKESEGTTFPNTPDNMKEVSVYDEIQLSSPAEGNPSETPNLTSSPSYYPECKTIYSMITNQKQDPHISLSLLSSPVSCGPNLHRDSTEDLQEPKYSHVEFRDAGDLNHFMKYNDLYSTAQEAVNKPNPIYSEISVSKTDSDPDHTDAVTPKQETSI